MATCIYFLKRFYFLIPWKVGYQFRSTSFLVMMDGYCQNFFWFLCICLWQNFFQLAPFFLKVNIVTTYCHSIFICKWFYLMTYFHNSDLTNIALNLEFKLIEWNLISLSPHFCLWIYLFLLLFAMFLSSSCLNVTNEI